MSIQPIVKVRLGSGPCVLIDGLSVVEKNEEWNTPHTILTRGQWISVRVDLRNRDVSLIGDGMEDW